MLRDDDEHKCHDASVPYTAIYIELTALFHTTMHYWLELYGAYQYRCASTKFLQPHYIQFASASVHQQSLTGEETQKKRENHQLTPHVTITKIHNNKLSSISRRSSPEKVSMSEPLFVSLQSSSRQIPVKLTFRTTQLRFPHSCYLFSVRDFSHGAFARDGYSQTYLSVFFIEIAFSTQVHGTVAIRGRIEHQLYIRSSCDECDFCVSFATSVLKSNLSFFLWSVSVACISDLRKIENRVRQKNTPTVMFSFLFYINVNNSYVASLLLNLYI